MVARGLSVLLALGSSSFLRAATLKVVPVSGLVAPMQLNILPLTQGLMNASGLASVLPDPYVQMMRGLTAMPFSRILTPAEVVSDGRGSLTAADDRHAAGPVAELAEAVQGLESPGFKPGDARQDPILRKLFEGVQGRRIEENATPVETSYQRGTMSKRALVQALIKRKYDPSVAERIVSKRPEVALKIMTLPVNEGFPATVYRGLVVDPRKYQPMRTTRQFKGEIFITFNLREANRYGTTAEGMDSLEYRSKHPVYTTLLEFQIPQFFIHQTEYMYSGTDLVFLRKEVPDESIFIVRMAAVKNEGQLGFHPKKNYVWFSFDEAFKGNRFIKNLPPLQPKL